jgi:hypothetical protein
MQIKFELTENNQSEIDDAKWIIKNLPTIGEEALIVRVHLPLLSTDYTGYIRTKCK